MQIAQIDKYSDSGELFLSAEDILDNAKLIIPALQSASQRIDESRRLPDDIVALLRTAGVFRAAAPRAAGGPEMTSIQQTHLVEIIATGDPAAGWCAMIGMDSGIYSGFLPEPTAQKVYHSLDMANSGWVYPQGRADRVSGGFIVSGNWRFGSGITHADVVIAGCRVFNEGVPEPDPETGDPLHWRVIVASPSDFELHDVWNTTGLCGSGSLDYSAEGLFIPDEQTFSFRQPCRDGPLYAAPDAILRKMAGVPLGLARACLDFVRKEAATRTDKETGLPWTNDMRVQSLIAQAEMKLNSARSAVYSTLEEQWQRLVAGQTPSGDERVAAALARLNAFRTAREIVQEMYDLIGASSIYKKSPMDRWLRDVVTMTQHAVSQSSILQHAGFVLLGGESRNPFF